MRLILTLLAVITAGTVGAQVITEEIEVRVINVDVVVTNARGERIPNLKRENFRLIEDRRPVDIRYFARYADGLMELDRAAPATTDATTDAASEPDAVRTPITWVIFLDQTSMHPGRRNQALRQLRSFLATAIASVDKAMLATIDGQAFRIRQNVTHDRAMFLAALARAEKEGVHPGPTIMEADAIRREMTHADPMDREFVHVGRTLAHRISFLITEEARRTQNAIASLGALLDVLARVEGRIALLYVGSGFSTLPGTSLAQSWRQVFSHVEDYDRGDIPGPEDHHLALEQEVTLLLNRLAASRITLYSIHPGSPLTLSADERGFVNMQPTMQGYRGTDAEILDDRSDLQQVGVTREMARRTGGLSFRLTPSLGRQLDAVRADLNDYYSLGYVPTGAARTRDIRVEVDVPGARVRHRDSVRERSRWEEAGHDLMAALVEPPRNLVATPLQPRDRMPATTVREEANPLRVAVQAEKPERVWRSREHILPFRFNMSLDDLTFVRRGDAHRADLVFHFALAGPDGTLWPIESREQFLEIPHTDVPAQADQVHYAWHLDLAPLRIPKSVPLQREAMKLMVSVVDRTSGVRSVVSVPVPRG